MSDDRAPITTDPIDVAWQRLQTSEAYWTGYSGMLIGGLIYSLLLSLFFTVLSYGMLGVVTLIVVTVGGLGLIGVIGAFVFLVVRAISASLNWPLSSRYAATAAACLTGLFVTFVPMLAAGVFQSGINFGFAVCGPAILVAFLQASAWLGADREIRKFEQRIAFSKSDKVVVEKQCRFGIGTLLTSTFWLAGTMAIFSGADRLGYFGEHKANVVVAVAFCVFLAAGLSAILVVVIKVLRALQKKLFYRKPRVGHQSQA